MEQSKVEQQGVRYTSVTWRAEAERRFGPDQMKWRFVCPACGHVQSVQDYKEAGASSDVVAFSCVGRWKGMNREAFERSKKRSKLPGPCNYAGGGFFRINPVIVVDEKGQEHNVFDFAPADPAPAPVEEKATKETT